MNVKRSICAWDRSFERVEPLDSHGNSLGVVFFDRFDSKQNNQRVVGQIRDQPVIRKRFRTEGLVKALLASAISIGGVILLWLGGRIIL